VEQGTQCNTSDLGAINSDTTSENSNSVPTSIVSRNVLPHAEITSEITVDPAVVVTQEPQGDTAPL